MMPRLGLTLSIMAILIGGTLVSAFVLLPVRWPSPRTDVYIGALPEPFRTAAGSAAAEWTSETGFRFTVLFDDRGACDNAGNLLNGIEFFPDDCRGVALGPEVLAVTEVTFMGDQLEAAGTTFNSDLDWAVYDTALRDGNPDFARVVLHELGHFLGLDHEDRVPSIMSSFADNTTTLQPDDLEGVRARYPELPVPVNNVRSSNCHANDLKALGSLCKTHFTCLAQDARDPNETRLLNCVSTVQSVFLDQHPCFSTGRNATAFDTLKDSLEILAQRIIEGTDPTGGQKVASVLIKKAGTQCKKAFAAEAKNSTKADAAKLRLRRSKARAAFLRKAQKVTQKAAQRGTPYTGPSPTVLADDVDSLVDAVVETVLP